MSIEAPLAGLLKLPLHLKDDSQLTEFVAAIRLKREQRQQLGSRPSRARLTPAGDIASSQENVERLLDSGVSLQMQVPKVCGTNERERPGDVDPYSDFNV